MYYAKIKNNDTADGLGVRVSLFVSGCERRCKGCHNKEAWDFDYGKEFTDETIEEIIEMLRPNHIDGLTILGGEPINACNVHDVCKLIKRVREEFHFTKTIWVYTGNTYDELDRMKKFGQKDVAFLLNWIDVLVDGPFIESKKDLSLNFRGSSNQNIYVFYIVYDEYASVYSINDILNSRKDLSEKDVPLLIQHAIEVSRDLSYGNWKNEVETRHGLFLE